MSLAENSRIQILLLGVESSYVGDRTLCESFITEPGFSCTFRSDFRGNARYPSTTAVGFTTEPSIVRRSASGASPYNMLGYYFPLKRH